MGRNLLDRREHKGADRDKLQRNENPRLSGAANADPAKRGDEQGRVVKSIYDFVNVEQKPINDGNNPKLISRSHAFRSQIEARLSLWSPEVEET